MSLVETEVTLRNAHDVMAVMQGNMNELEVRQVTVNTMVDTDAWTLVINEAVRDRLGFDVLSTEEQFSMAYPMKIKWKNHHTTCDALIFPNADDILHGAIPLEVMDLR